MLCADLASARAWIRETLGELAVDSSRNEGLRETHARVPADRRQLHGDRRADVPSPQHGAVRVRKAEEVRGRPLRDGRLDVELALLACHWMKTAVLQTRP